MFLSTSHAPSVCYIPLIEKGRHDNQHYVSQYNDTQHNTKVIAKLSITTLNALC
jgi:hypothetical protein